MDTVGEFDLAPEPEAQHGVGFQRYRGLVTVLTAADVARFCGVNCRNVISKPTHLQAAAKTVEALAKLDQLSQELPWDIRHTLHVTHDARVTELLGLDQDNHQARLRAIVCRVYVHAETVAEHFANARSRAAKAAMLSPKFDSCLSAFTGEYAEHFALGFSISRRGGLLGEALQVIDPWDTSL